MSGYSLDEPSSPDPLSDFMPSSVAPPSTRRVNRSVMRSHASTRFASAPGTSPRKRIFELDVGDEVAPQRILVTVEAEPSSDRGMSGVSRRLFGSPSSATRQRKTTTTTVPLRGLTDDEAGPTPRRRRRSSNRPATPAAGSAKKRKGTPNSKATTSKARKTPTASSDNLRSDITEATPKPRRGRPPKRKEPPAASEKDDELAGPQHKKRGRTRNSGKPDALLSDTGSTHDGHLISNLPEPLATSDAPDGFFPETDITDEVQNASDEPEPRGDERDEDTWMVQPSDPPLPTRRLVPEANIGDDGQVAADDEEDEDIWLAQAYKQPTRASRQSSQENESRLESPATRHGKEHDVPLVDLIEPQRDASDDYAPMMEYDDRSDVESQNSGQAGDGDGDYTVDPESFTMINMHSMPSMQANYDATQSDLSEIGETTSLIINKTLASLRQDMAASEEDDVGLLGPGKQTPRAAAASPSRSVRQTASPDNAQPGPSPRNRRLTASPEANRAVASSAISGAAVSPRNTRATTSSGNRKAKASPNKRTEISLASEDVSLHHWSRSPRRKGQLLSRQVALKTLQQDNQPSATTNYLTEIAQVESSRANEEDASAYEDSFSEIPDEVLAAATPRRIYGSHKQLELQQQDSDKDTEIEMEIESSYGMEMDEELQNTSPRYPTLPQTNDDEEIQQSSSSHPQYPHTGPKQDAERVSPSQPLQSSSELNEDAQQDSPTPLRPPHSHPLSAQATEQMSQPQSLPSNQGTNHNMEETSPSYSIRSHTESNRLLTPPDETSSPTNGVTPEKQKSVVSEIRSSPPEFGNFDPTEERPIHRLRQSSDTPALRLSPHLSPLQERLTQSAALPQVSGPRPGLSPIVRAGMTLQTIMSDPPSPSAHSSVLGSPFKGSVRNSSPMAEEDPFNAEALQPSAPITAPMPAQPAEHSWSRAFAPLSQLKNLVVQSALTFSSPRVNAATPSLAQGLDDPFGPSAADGKRPVNSGQSSFMDRVTQASRHASRSVSVRIPTRNEPRSEDEMSWAGEASPRTTNLEADIQSQSSSVLGTKGSKSVEDNMEPNQYAEQEMREEYDQEQEQVVEQGSEHEHEPDHDEDAEQLGQEYYEDDDEEEDDIWAIEAQRRTSMSPKASRAREESIIPGRRTRLRIAWMDQDKTASRSPALKSGPSAAQEQSDHFDEYSMLSVDTSKSSPKKATMVPEPVRSNRVDLSDFFSSSSPIFSKGVYSEAAHVESPNQDVDVNHVTVDSTRLTGIQKGLSSVPQKAFVPGRRRSADLFSPERIPTGDTTEEAESQSSTPATPDQPLFDHIPQKKNFTPVRGQGGRSLFSQGSNTTIGVSPVRQPQTSDRPQTPDDAQESSFEAPSLKPLPCKAASPPKSCMRSPLKPKTPGRVVEFTSSTLSPLAQAQARAQDCSGSSPADATSALSRTHSNVQPRDTSRFGGKENQGQSSLNSSLALSPRNRHLIQLQPQKQVANSPLSQSHWTRNHWLLLDNLLQKYRKAPLEFQLKYSSSIRLSPSKRPSHSLLGKLITSQTEEAMTLEQWHLDIVDAFKKEVGGWGEDVLAKRLFALMVGEERRKAGKVPKRR